LGIIGTRVISVTLDTNILPAEDLLAAVPSGDFEFAVVSVTDREVEASTGLVAPSSVNRVPETAVWGESIWDDAVWGGPSEGDCLERALVIIGDGSFPPPNRRDTLTDGERRQLRDAMIFCAHVRAQRQIFVTDDSRGFVRGGRRQQLEKSFGTRIMTRNEFISDFGAQS
jgi:hypothetical protein